MGRGFSTTSLYKKEISESLAVKITPRLIELTYEALLKSYWRRNASQRSEAYLPVSKFGG